MKRIAIALFAIFAVVAVTGCGGNDQAVETEPFAAHFDIVMEDETKQYDPMEMTVSGNNGTIEVSNQLDAEHGFVIREFGIEATVPAGETMTFDVDSVAPGEYMVDCHLHSAHAEATLIVEAP